MAMAAAQQAERAQDASKPEKIGDNASDSVPKPSLSETRVAGRTTEPHAAASSKDRGKR